MRHIFDVKDKAAWRTHAYIFRKFVLPAPVLVVTSQSRGDVLAIMPVPAQLVDHVDVSRGHFCSEVPVAISRRNYDIQQTDEEVCVGRAWRERSNILQNWSSGAPIDKSDTPFSHMASWGSSSCLRRTHSALLFRSRSFSSRPNCRRFASHAYRRRRWRSREEAGGRKKGNGTH